MDNIIYKIAETAAEREGHFAVRRAIFVEEQELFVGTDVDEYDEHAAHIVAIAEPSARVVGAVRCYSVGNAVWYGGRLAVLADYRRHGAAIGANLCRVARATVIAHGCQLFLAYIQAQNIPFFERLGWHPHGDVVVHFGIPHQLMSASLTLPGGAPRRIESEHGLHV